MFVVFYTVKIVHICVFMTCSTSNSLTDPRNVCLNTWDFPVVPIAAAFFYEIHSNFLLTLHSRISVIQNNDATGWKYK